MKGRLYTAREIDEVAAFAGQRALILAKEDRITPLALDRARELGIDVVFGDGEKSGVPTWSGAALQMRRKRDSKAPASPDPQPLAPAPSIDPPADLETLVRQAVVAILGQSSPASGSQAGVVHITGGNLDLPPCQCANAGPEMDVRRQEVITQAQGAPLTAGFMSLRKGQFPRSLSQDEIAYVIEGELHIETEQGRIVGKPGDVLYVPKGARIACGTPDWAKFFYVTFPDKRAQG